MEGEPKIPFEQVEPEPTIPETTIGTNKDASEEKETNPEEKREFQMRLIREWAHAQKPPLIEGQDFSLPSIEDEIPAAEIAPHERTSIYLGFKKEHFHKFTDFFLADYPQKMRQANMREPWSKDVSLNYSWAGRYLVAGEGGIAIDSAPVESIESPLCRTEHSKLKNFFKERNGFELPSIDKLNEIMMKMSERLDWYERALAELKRTQEKSTEKWQYDSAIMKMEYACIILRDAKKLQETYKILDIVKNLGSAEGIEKAQDEIKKYRLSELEEEFTDLPKKVRHYNDLTYNADDLGDLEEVVELLEGKIDLPEGEGARIDRIYEDYYNFDRKKFEDTCREFSNKLFPKE